MPKDIIIACDFDNSQKCLSLLDKLEGHTPWLKVGMELFYAEGPAMVEKLKARGAKIFLDLKVHDIPNTIMRVMRVLSSLDVDMINLHAGGGVAMMEAAMEGLSGAKVKPIVVAVTLLTSLGQREINEELLIPCAPEDGVLHYAKNAKAAGLCGVVCSPLEAGLIHAQCGADFVTVTPGIRFADGEKGDQTRVTTPAMARQIGSDYIVVGRPITGADDPRAVYERVKAEFLG